MATYEILHVSEDVREWTAKKGPAAGQTFKSYTVRAKGPDGVERNYEISRKPDSPPPPLGAVEAEVKPSQGDFPDKLKLQPQGGGGWQKHLSDGVRSDTRDEAWFLAKDMRISRAGIMQAVVSAHPYVPQTISLESYVATVNTVTDALLASLDERTPHPSSHAASGGGAASSKESPAPPNGSAPESAPIGFASPKQADYFESLLKKTPATPETRGQIVLYATTRPTDDVSKWIDQLKSENAVNVAKALAQDAAEWARNQSDVPADEDGLPPLNRDPNAVVGGAEDIPF